MNNNKEKYKQTFSAVRPTNESVERILSMTNEKKKFFRPMPVVAAALCMILLVTATFGTGAVKTAINSDKDKVALGDNVFTITAFASDKQGNKSNEVQLVENEKIQTGTTIRLQDDDPIATGSPYSVHTDCDSGFMTTSKDISKVTYSCKHGSFNFQSLMYNNFNYTVNDTEYDPEIPYASSITINYTDNEEMLEVYYMPEEAIDTLLKTLDRDYSKLIGDTITIEIEFKNGEKTTKTIETSFDKDGHMLMEYK